MSTVTSSKSTTTSSTTTPNTTSEPFIEEDAVSWKFYEENCIKKSYKWCQVFNQTVSEETHRMKIKRGKITALSAAQVVSCLKPAISVIIGPVEDRLRLIKAIKINKK